jgi:dynein light chain roadblock-type
VRCTALPCTALHCTAMQQSKNVTGVMVTNDSGMPVKSTLDSSASVQYGAMVRQLAESARGVVRDLDPTNQLTFLRVRSVKHELLVAPEAAFVLIVLQSSAKDEER